MSEERIEEMDPFFYDAVFSIRFFISASRYRMDGWRLKIKYIYKMMWMKIFYSHLITSCFSHILLHFFRNRQRSNAIDGSNIDSYGLL